MSQNTPEPKKRFECDQCEKSYVTKDALKKHKEDKHSKLIQDERGENQQKNENSKSEATKVDVQEEKEEKIESEENTENYDDFQEDKDFDEIIEDLDLYDALDNITQKMSSDDTDISLGDIKSLNEKLLRFKVNMKKKEEIQAKTKVDLSKVTKKRKCF